ncbi:unnamed protein product [Hyaloperonospora brassicae]|uniref:C2H2-type domain-containing protein n=1 Tax=Hyaloperonospora brassicae TaxID=162125 RepID=A0AAV0V438_HYABA|nr:unnamed protein product [Hyaloperonospora brassicae]
MPPMYDVSPTNSAIDLERFRCVSAGVVANEVGDRCCDYDNGPSAALLTRATMPETVERQQVEHSGRSVGIWGNTAVNNTGGTYMTMSAALEALSSSPAAAGIACSTSAAPSRKRKRIPGAMRMRNFLCTHPGCGKSFADSAHLRDHTVVHTGEKPYVCGVPGCNKRYSSRAAMRFHRSSHTSQRSLTAEQSRGEIVRAGVDGNASPTQDAQMPPFTCLECGKHFCVHELLMAHLGVHAAHRAAAIASISSSENAVEHARRSEEEAGAVQWHVHGEESLPSVGAPPRDESREFRNTIRAQQDQIERLKAEVLRLRRKIAADPVATPAPTAVVVGDQPALTPPVEMLHDGYKPFECCICHNRFTNFYQLTFHGKQHPQALMAEVTGKQVPVPVGPKHCPDEQCEYAKSTGRSLKNLQTLKRHWQRRHQNERPYTCTHCPPTRQKTFKTRENLKAHQKDCPRNIFVCRDLYPTDVVS